MSRSLIHATEADARAAQAAVDEWVHLRALDLGAMEPGMVRDLLALRGILTSWAADVRYAGHLEGIQRGRQEAAHVVLDALRGEGLAP